MANFISLGQSIHDLGNILGNVPKRQKVPFKSCGALKVTLQDGCQEELLYKTLRINLLKCMKSLSIRHFGYIIMTICEELDIATIIKCFKFHLIIQDNAPTTL